MLTRHSASPSTTRAAARPLAAAIGLALAAVTVGAAAPARADDWSSLGFTADRGRLSNERSGGNFDVAPWQHDLESTDPLAYRAIFASPAIADGVLVFATQRNLVRALREDDGRVLWQGAMGGGIYGSPAILRGYAFIPGSNQQLYAVRIADGSIAWQRPLGGVAYASPTVVDDSILIAVGHPAPRVLRIDANSGATVWEAGAGLLRQAADASVAVAGGRVLVGETGGATHSFALADGAWQWTAATAGTIDSSSPLVLGDWVFVLPGGPDPRLHALDLQTGKPIAGWPISLPTPADLADKTLLSRSFAVSSPAGAPGIVVVTVRTDEHWRSNADGQPEVFVARESVFALDPATGQLLWSLPNGRRDVADANQLPTHGFCPTPALYRTGGDVLLVAAASSLQARLRVLGARDGGERWAVAISAPTRSSPVFANGRLVVATDSGMVHSFASGVNLPPVAPTLGFSPADGSEVDAAGLVLKWGAAVDREGDEVRYQVRLDDDGEILHDWQVEANQLASESLSLAGRVQAGRLYTFAVRARDSQGAWSAWSRSETFRTVGSPAVTIDGQPAASLVEAVAVAGPGAVIRLGAGVFALAGTLTLPAGVTLAGAGPHLTTLRGKDLAIAVAARAGSQLQQLTVAAARVGISVAGESDVAAAMPVVLLRNVILRDNVEVGLHVQPGGQAEIVNATILRNGVGVRAEGTTGMRNALVTLNNDGIVGTDGVAFTSRYNDVFANRARDLVNAQAAASDLAVPVVFADDDDTGTRLAPRQPTTDRGDPADEFINEPAPNGGRINMGAFGNTPFAELSEADLGGADAGWDTVDAGASGDTANDADGVGDASGCHCRAGAGPGAAGPGMGALGALAIALLLVRRRAS